MKNIKIKSILMNNLNYIPRAIIDMNFRIELNDLHSALKGFYMKIFNHVLDDEITNVLKRFR